MSPTTYTNDKGETIRKRKIRVTTGTTKEVERNLTKLYERAGNRHTGNSEILGFEHELITNGVAVGNPAEPVNPDDVPTAVGNDIADLETVAEAREFITREVELGPRQYVIARANERLQALKEATDER